MQKKKYMPVVVIMLIALVAEIFICNISFWKTLGCKPIQLAGTGQTNESGYFDTGKVSIQGPVKNVLVKVSGLSGTDRAKALACITDEGNEYEYATPYFTIVPGVDKSGYANIYPYGDVNEISVYLEVEAGAVAEIEGVYVNVQAPFSFKIVRVLAFCVFGLLFYGVFRKTPIHTWYCKRGDRYQKIIICVAVVFFCLLGYFLVTSNPKCVESPWPHHRQYQELARSWAQGKVTLDYAADTRLIEKANPYDTIALQVEGIDFLMDYAYYNGNYYVYFGLVPEIPYYLFHVATGGDLDNYMAFYLFYIGFVIGVWGLVWELVHRFTEKLPFYLYVLFGTVVCLFPNYVFMGGRPDLYNIPIMAGTCFTMLGIWQWLAGLNAEKRKGLHYITGSLCMALVSGCRPQLLLYSAVAIPLFYREIRRERRLFSKKSLKETMCLVMPYIMVGIVVFAYNAMRFGSGFDFGATYSLTTNDMNHRGFNLSRLFHGLYSYLIQPPVINSGFPFLETSNLRVAYMGRNITEFMYGGIFAVNPLLWIIPITVILGGYKKLDTMVKTIVAALCSVSLIIVMFDVNSAGNLQRYVADMVPGFLLAAIILWMVILDRGSENIHYEKWARLVTICAFCGVAFAFLTFIASGDSVCLEKNCASLFYQIESYFKF